MVNLIVAGHRAQRRAAALLDKAAKCAREHGSGRLGRLEAVRLLLVRLADGKRVDVEELGAALVQVRVDAARARRVVEARCRR